LIAAYFSGSAVVALLGMVVGQIVSIFIIIAIFRDQNLPRIKLRPQIKLSILFDSEYRKIGVYTIAASLGVVFINLIQIVDLMVFKSRPSEAIFYTDLYIISRVVFFSGAIFIWPFMSEIRTDNKKMNLILILKFFGIVCAIGFTAVAVLYVFGENITKILFNASYSTETLIHYGILSIALKCAFLFLTTLTLYLVVIGKRAAFYLPLITATLLLVFVKSINNSSSANYILYGLNIIAFTSIMLYIVTIIADSKS